MRRKTARREWEAETESARSPAVTPTKLKQQIALWPHAVWSALCYITSQLTWKHTLTDYPPPRYLWARPQSPSLRKREREKKIKKLPRKGRESLSDNPVWMAVKRLRRESESFLFSLFPVELGIREELVNLWLIKGYLCFRFELAVTKVGELSSGVLSCTLHFSCSFITSGLHFTAWTDSDFLLSWAGKAHN